MKKLYRIKVLHGAPKDSHTSTETYLLAEDDEEVAYWIEQNKHHGNWFTPYDGDEPRMCYADDDYLDDEDMITFKEWILKNKGDLEDEEGWEDAYYGVTKWGWEEVDGATEQDITRLFQLKIALNA